MSKQRTTGNESAYPQKGAYQVDWPGAGLTKREYMAIEFMKIPRTDQELAGHQLRHRNLNPQAQDIGDRTARALSAIADADALIAELNK